MSEMRDSDLRAALHAKVLRDHHDQPETLVVDELALWYGTARVDIAVVNGRMHGYEIKSDRDKLGRLAGQSAVYNDVFDRVTLVVGKKHLEGVVVQCPVWWGIKLATRGARSAVHFEEVRSARLNPTISPVAVAALLWAEELESLLAEHGAVRGYRGKSRDVLSRRVAGMLPLKVLQAAVRDRLKRRGDWRAALRRTSDGDSSQQPAK